MMESIVSGLVGIFIGFFAALACLAETDSIVEVRDISGTSVVKYQDKHYKLVPVEIKTSVEVVE